MAEQWKPGDVAMVTHQATHPAMTVAIRAGADSWYGDGCIIPDAVTVTARRLVVIDPEDRAQMERLLEAHNRAQVHAFGEECGSGSCWIGEMQDALREFANPLCQHSLSVDAGQTIDNYACDRPEGHDGAHMDESRGMSWTARAE